jgi:sulfide dehydrogenase cytochrome subunit
MSTRHILASAVAACLLSVGAVRTAAAADDPLVNQLLASQCAQCHGTYGNAVREMEDIAGESASELSGELLEMLADSTPEDIMDHQGKGYTRDQIRRIAAYYSALPKPSGSGSDDD